MKRLSVFALTALTALSIFCMPLKAEELPQELTIEPDVAIIPEQDERIGSEIAEEAAIPEEDPVVSVISEGGLEEQPEELSEEASGEKDLPDIGSAVKAKRIEKCTITIPKKKYVYIGKKIGPTVKVKDNGLTLTKNTDFKVRYSDNVNVGTATIKVTGIGDYKGTQTIHFEIIPRQKIPLEKIRLSRTGLKIAQGRKYRLKAVLTPDNTTDKKITWKSSDPNTAVVSADGVVKAVSPGDAVITAFCQDKKAKCRVRVNIPGIITLIDDDGNKDYLNKILPIVKEKGVNYSVSVTPDRIRLRPQRFMSWDEISLCADAGAEVLCHTLKHHTGAQTREMTEAEIRAEYKKAKKIMKEHGYNDRILIYSGSTGHVPQAREAASKVFDCGISATGKQFATFDDDPYYYKRFGLLPYLHDRTDVIRGWIDQLKKEGGWMICITHSYEPTLDQEALDNLRGIIDYAKDKKIEIVTAQEGFTRTRNAGK